MTVQFTKLYLIILIAAVVAVVASFLIGYSSYIAPVYGEKEVLAENLEFEENQVQILNQQIRSLDSNVLETSFALQRKLPVQPLLDQFLLDISRAEGLSGSYILNINISESGDVTLAEGESIKEQISTEVEQNSALPEKIEDLRKITVFLSVRANDYEALANFLREIDSLPRLTNIDSVNFLGHDEKIMVNDSHQSLEFSVLLSTYYYPPLAQLREESPKIDFPNPANKDNRLYSR